MSDRDVLKDATKALREANTGTRPGSGFTRARIMRTLHDRRRRRLSVWATFGPLLGLLVGTTAWAQATGRLPELWQQAQALFVATEAPTLPAKAIPEVADPGKVRSGARVDPEPPEPTPSPVEVEEAEPETLEHEPGETAPPPTLPRAVPAIARAPSVTLEPEPVGEAAPDAELQLFREGHDLHFKKRAPAQAIEAYRRYLEQYPQGRFVPEARYNTALNLLKLRQEAPARQLLESFAAGAYGNYRKSEARDLLRALDRIENGGE